MGYRAIKQAWCLECEALSTFTARVTGAITLRCCGSVRHLSDIEKEIREAATWREDAQGRVLGGIEKAAAYMAYNQLEDLRREG